MQARIQDRAERIGTQGVAATRATQVPNRDDDDRSWIAHQIIYVFVGAIGGVLLLLLCEGFASKGAGWSLVADRAADLIKTAVVPIVTLVLGYYFGKSGKG